MRIILFLVTQKFSPPDKNSTWQNTVGYFVQKGATNEHFKVKYVKSSMACEAAQTKLRFKRTDPGENPPGFPKVFADTAY